MKSLRKIFALLLTLCSITSLLVLGIHAFGETEEIDEVRGEAVEWEYDPDQNVLVHGEVVYEEFFLPSGIEIFAHDYRYNGSVVLDEHRNSRSPVRQIMPDPEKPEVYRDIAYLYDSYIDDNRIFVTENGKAVLESLVRGEYTSYRFAKTALTMAEIPQEYLIDLGERQPNLQIDVKRLRSAQEYLIYGVDATGIFAHPVGAIYETVDGNGFIYVHFDSLESNALEGDGTLSFRQGEVPAYAVSTAIATELITRSTSVNTMTYSQFDFEEDVPLEQTPALILFAIMMSPYLYIAPILLLVMGIILRSVKKVPARKRWNALIVLPSLWLLCSLAITVLCVVAILI